MSSVEMLLDAIRTRDVAGVRALLDGEPELVHARGSNGESPVMTAIYAGTGIILAMLVARGAEVDVLAAAALGSVEQIDARLRADPGAVHATSTDGWTPLHLAAHFGQTDAAALLLRRGADARALARNAMANTPLHAALAGQAGVPLVEMLLAHRADVNGRGAAGATPLHLAASRGSLALVETLLEHGAAPAARMDDGSTAADVAAARGHDAVAERLRRHTPAPAAV
jgi:uncharacterized protein